MCRIVIAGQKRVFLRMASVVLLHKHHFNPIVRSARHVERKSGFPESAVWRDTWCSRALIKDQLPSIRKLWKVVDILTNDKRVARSVLFVNAINGAYLDHLLLLSPVFSLALPPSKSDDLFCIAFISRSFHVLFAQDIAKRYRLAYTC